MAPSSLEKKTQISEDYSREKTITTSAVVEKEEMKKASSSSSSSNSSSSCCCNTSSSSTTTTTTTTTTTITTSNGNSSKQVECARKRVVVPAEALETSGNGEGIVPESKTSAAEEESGRERLKRHRSEMAGKVWIPETWGQERLLQDWKDCSVIDRSLFPTGLLSAREALVEEGRRASSRRVRIGNSC